jgi:hypothetical protein
VTNREKIEELKGLVEGGGNSGWYFTLKDTALPLIEALQAELSVAWADCENESAPCRACAWCYDRLEGENRRLREALEKGPHMPWCLVHEGARCNCWKDAALSTTEGAK